MNFDLEEAIAVLERTPASLEALLAGLPLDWVECTEGEGTWCATEVIGHLIGAEETNWIPRLTFMMHHGEDAAFPPFDRVSHLRGNPDPPIERKLETFKALRMDNIAKLRELAVSADMLERTGFHPAFNVVKARELIAAWVVHDFTHIAQIVRTMAKRYRTDVGPWQSYLGILST